MGVFSRSGSALVWGVVAWLVVAALLAIQLWPYLPQSGWGWLVFIALAPPLYLLAEFAVERFWASRAGRVVTQHPSTLVRIVLGVLVMMVVCGALWGGLWAVGLT